MEKRTFKQCTIEFLEKEYQLEQIYPLSILEDWLKMPQAFSEREKYDVPYLQERLIFNLLSWNEQELSLNFIGPLFGLINFSSKKYNFFAERYISAKIGNYELSGEPDGMIASGFRSPEVPFFAFQEYKKEKDPNGDPMAQTLAAMLVGQALNEKETPIYGCYVIGQNWSFMVLNGKEYAISGSYSAIQPNDIWDIVRILKSLKEIILHKL